ncbi:MAG TPA: collagen-binding domain-containing protein [Acetobacteraceae bacterium]|nr:collagen-binding domain-containing protein [Acetobacteraceae bacterium]
MKFRLLSLWCFGAVLAWGTPAGAQSLSDSQILQQFNAVILGNFSTSADVDGRTLIGGNMTGGATFAVNPAAEAASTFAALTVYGNETSSNPFNLDNAQAAMIAGTNAGNFNLNGGGSVFVGGNNTGAFASSSGGASVSVVGRNSGQISLGSGGSVAIGAANSGNISINGGTGTVAINGKNSGYLTLNSGGSVKVNGNAGSGQGNRT